MGKIKTETEPRLHSAFIRREFNTISDVFEYYLTNELTQELANVISFECGKFLVNSKGISPKLVEREFGILFNFNTDKDLIFALGKNLLSSLWIIGVYPANPQKLVNKQEYKNGDFVYKFYTKNKNLVIEKTNNHDGKLTDNQ